MPGSPCRSHLDADAGIRPARRGAMRKAAGQAHVESAGVGLLNAETIRLFLLEDQSSPPNAAGRRRLVPDRLQAFERVHFESPTLAGDVNHLQVWAKTPARQRLGRAGRGACDASPAVPVQPVSTQARRQRHRRRAWQG